MLRQPVDSVENAFQMALDIEYYLRFQLLGKLGLKLKRQPHCLGTALKQPQIYPQKEPKGCLWLLFIALEQ